MEEQSNFDKVNDRLVRLKEEKSDDQKLNSLIDIVIHQNSQTKSIFEDLKKLMESHKNSLELLSKSTNSNNGAFEAIYNWMNVQNSRNESVDVEFGKIMNKLNDEDKS